MSAVFPALSDMVTSMKSGYATSATTTIRRIATDGDTRQREWPPRGLEPLVPLAGGSSVTTSVLVRKVTSRPIASCRAEHVVPHAGELRVYRCGARGSGISRRRCERIYAGQGR